MRLIVKSAGVIASCIALHSLAFAHPEAPHEVFDFASRAPGPEDDAFRRLLIYRILPNLERRYRETDSAAVKEELAKYLNNKPCPECDGTRLRREARLISRSRLCSRWRRL